MSNFKSFTSIRNVTDGRFVQKAFDFLAQTGVDLDFEATEKLHGTNFSFWYIPGKGVVPGKRTAFIEEDESFFDYKPTFNKHAKAFKDFSEAVYPNYVVVVTGEFFGGNIQSEVDYGSERRFAAFELSVNDYVYSAQSARTIFSQMGFEPVPLIATGKLADLLAIDPNFRSTLTAIPEGSDDIRQYAEGLVIQPVIWVELHNGSRLILKHKTPRFMHKVKLYKPKTPTVLSEDAKAVFDELCERVTEGRLSDILGKFGKPASSDFGKIMGLYFKDILAELESELEDGELNAIDRAGDDWKKVSKLFSSILSNSIRPAFIAAVQEGD